MNPSDLARVSAALQRQVTRDLAPIWHVSATVDPFPSLEDVPAGYWPIIVTFRPLGSEAGIHVDQNGQPYALIEMSPSWSLTASHVSIEMITDPFGSRSFPGISPRSDQGDVEFRGGVCDPCEHPDHAYLINDVLVSDFCTPAFWEPTSREQRSFTGAIQEAHQVLPGGHMCWYDPTSNTWWLRQRRITDGAVTDIEVGVADPERGTVREFICQHSLHLQSTKMTTEAFEARVGTTRQRALRASQSRAYWLRSAIDRSRVVHPLEMEAEVRAELQAARAARKSLDRHREDGASTGRPPRDVQPRASTPGASFPRRRDRAGADEDAFTVDESALEQSVLEQSALEQEISQAFARAREARAAAAAATKPSVAPVERAPSREAMTPPAPPVSESQPPPSYGSGRGRTLPPPLPASLPPPTPPPSRVASRSEPARADDRRTLPHGSMGRGGSIGEGPVGATTGSFRPTSWSGQPVLPAVASTRNSWAVTVGVVAVALIAASAFVLRRSDGATAAAGPGPAAAPAAAAPVMAASPAPSPILIVDPAATASNPAVAPAPSPSPVVDLAVTAAPRIATPAAGAVQLPVVAVAAKPRAPAALPSPGVPTRAPAAASPAVRSMPAANAPPVLPSVPSAEPASSPKSTGVAVSDTADEFGGRQ
jgi:hypothetical protein